MSRGINNQHVYRIAYESFSKFSNNLNRCSSLPEVGEVIQKHLKYLFNFHYLKLSLQLDEKLFAFEMYGNQLKYYLKGEKAFFNFEKEVLNSGIPIKLEEILEEIPQDFFQNKKLQEPNLWSWLFEKKERKIVLTLVSDREKPFTVGDIEILKLAVDNFDAKFHEIYLARQLEKKNKSLLAAYETIKNKNNEISKIVEAQKDVITERTKEIVVKNEKLLEISVLNAHNVREPLSRILGLVELFDLMDDTTCREELIPKLSASAKEMDTVLQQVIKKASEEIINLKASKL